MSYPEHEKLQKIQDKTQTVGEFLDWLVNEREVVLAKWIDGTLEERLAPINPSIQDLIAEFFGVDQNKLEAEKRAMLKVCRGEE